MNIDKILESLAKLLSTSLNPYSVAFLIALVAVSLWVFATLDRAPLKERGEWLRIDKSRRSKLYTIALLLLGSCILVLSYAHFTSSQGQAEALTQTPRRGQVQQTPAGDFVAQELPCIVCLDPHNPRNRRMTQKSWVSIVWRDAEWQWKIRAKEANDSSYANWLSIIGNCDDSVDTCRSCFTYRLAGRDVDVPVLLFCEACDHNAAGVPQRVGRALLQPRYAHNDTTAVDGGPYGNGDGLYDFWVIRPHPGGEPRFAFDFPEASSATKSAAASASPYTHEQR